MIKLSHAADGKVAIITIDNVERRNAVNRDLAASLTAHIITHIEHDPAVCIGILTGAGGTFCSGADLKAIAQGQPNRTELDGDSPMGPCRLLLTKPVIAAISGPCVAGGLELALWCDLRVMDTSPTSVMGVFCRRFGVPLIDGGTVRLPRLIGMSRALDLILTGRPVSPKEALDMGLVHRLAPPGEALSEAVRLAESLCAFPQEAMRGDRLSAYEQWAMGWEEALRNEMERGMKALSSESMRQGTRGFAFHRQGRHGEPTQPHLPSRL